MAPAALGSDGGGSIRIPAALCGVVGFKASMGRVPLYPGCRDERYPGFSGWESIEHIGPLARTVADIALVTSVISGPDPRDRLSIPCADVDWLGSTSGGVRGLRVAFSADWGYAPVDPDVRDVAARAARLFEHELGCRVEEAHPGFSDSAEAFAALVALETDLVGMREQLKADPRAFSPDLAAMVERRWSGTDFTQAVVQRKRVANAMWRFMRNYDLVLTPTVSVTAFELEIGGPATIGGRKMPDPAQGWTPFTYIMNLTGQPAISVPAGWTTGGLPVGLHICGPHLGDSRVLRAAAAFEAVAPWAHRWPPALISRAKERER
jgi:aspartyl-tRNA(Asn)/glutamyl-tRNA(Gln) amidotransferase subunit A